MRINDLGRGVQQLVDPEHGPNGGHVALERCVKPPVAAEPANRFVEVQIGATNRCQIATLHSATHAVDDRVQLVDDPPIHRDGDHPRSRTLDCRAKVVDLPYVPTAQPDHERPPPGLLKDESLGAQHLQGFADWPAADLELTRQSRLDEMLPTSESAGEDLLPDRIGCVFRTKLGCHRLTSRDRIL